MYERKTNAIISKNVKSFGKLKKNSKKIFIVIKFFLLIKILELCEYFKG